MRLPASRKYRRHYKLFSRQTFEQRQMQKEENEERGSLRFAFVIRFGALPIGGDRVDWESGASDGDFWSALPRVSTVLDRDRSNKPWMRTGTVVFSDFWTMVPQKETFHLILAYNMFKSQFISCYLWYSHSNPCIVFNVLYLLVYFKETWLQENDISKPIKKPIHWVL